MKRVLIKDWVKTIPKEKNQLNCRIHNGLLEMGYQDGPKYMDEVTFEVFRKTRNLGKKAYSQFCNLRDNNNLR